MKKYDSSSNWDALRLVKEYIKIADVVKNDTLFNSIMNNQFDSLPWDAQVRVQRLAAVLRAFCQDDNSDRCPLETIRLHFPCSCSEFDINDIDSLKANLLKLFDSERVKYMLEVLNSSSERLSLVDTLINYRIASGKLLFHFSNILECSRGVGVGIDITHQLYVPRIMEADDVVDRLIVQLLGKRFQTSFTVAELIEKYRYPTVTDEELYEYLLDSM